MKLFIVQVSAPGLPRRTIPFTCPGARDRVAKLARRRGFHVETWEGSA